MTNDQPTAAARYKEIVSRASEAAEELRAWEADRAEELTSLIAAARKNVTAAAEDEETMTEQAHRWWRMAEDNVTRLSWLEIEDFPEPVTPASTDRPEDHAERMRSAYQELSRAILALNWFAR